MGSESEGTMVSIVIPALNESARIAQVVGHARRSPLVGEVVVIDDGSIDGTGELAEAAGARVVMSSLLGKGASMRDGLEAATGDVVVYLDGDLTGLAEDLVERLCEPILSGEAAFVKAKFSREAGRVTVLTARPLLELFFPEVAKLAQPLGGIMAARREVLEELQFEDDYGVDLGILLDVAAAGHAIAEVDIGHLEHESQSLEALGRMAQQVVRTLLERAERSGRLTLDRRHALEEAEWQRKSEVAYGLGRLRQVEKLALFDMDGTLTRERFVVQLAAATGKQEELKEWLDREDMGAAVRATGIANLFAGVRKELFQEVARGTTLTSGAVETVVELRKAGYRVGIVTDSYVVAAEMVRRRVFADFVLANQLRFRSGKATGEVRMSPAWWHGNGCTVHTMCKGNAVRYLLDRLDVQAENVLAVGDSWNDLCMFAAAGRSVAFEPKSKAVREAAALVVEGDLRQVCCSIAEIRAAVTQSET